MFALRALFRAEQRRLPPAAAIDLGCDLALSRGHDQNLQRRRSSHKSMPRLHFPIAAGCGRCLELWRDIGRMGRCLEGRRGEPWRDTPRVCGRCAALSRLCARFAISCARPGARPDATSRSNRDDAWSVIAHLPAPTTLSAGYTRGRLEERAQRAQEWRPASTMPPPLRLPHTDPPQCRSPAARAQG
jgi:hypothetical protein